MAVGTCIQIRIAAMAIADGETSVFDQRVVDQHLHGCEACREAVNRADVDHLFPRDMQRLPVQSDSWTAIRQRLVADGSKDSQKMLSLEGPSASPERLRDIWVVGGWAAAATLVVTLIWGASRFTAEHVARDSQPAVEERPEDLLMGTPWRAVRVVARPRRQPPAVGGVAVGTRVVTKAGQQRRCSLPDGSVLYLDGGTSIEVVKDRHMKLEKGRVFVEVSPRPPAAAEATGEGATDGARTFVVDTPQGAVSAFGTKFAVDLKSTSARVIVTQGKVKVPGVDAMVRAGQLVSLSTEGAATNLPTIELAQRTTHLLSWMQPLVDAAEAALVPGSEHAGGSLIAVDPNGQEAKLSLRKYHVDVHIEDGFARTTIDQTYFNHLNSRLEGTFRFPLPPAASISRLAMYVGEELMEGGMAERDYARRVFESIKYRQLDPALLEWIDGSTFKMRVFPLEGRQEKRIVLSYTQRLPALYDRTTYRFPAGHTMSRVAQWSLNVRAVGAGGRPWECKSHEVKSENAKGDLILTAEQKEAALDTDVVVELYQTARSQSESRSKSPQARFSMARHEGNRYLMIRYRPHLSTRVRKGRRDWIVLFEASADRNPLLARAQIDVLRGLLENVEHEDTLTILTASTNTRMLGGGPVAATAENVRRAIERLNEVHLVGAIDLEKAFMEARKAARSLNGEGGQPHLIHIGSGVAVLGQRDPATLARLASAGVTYVGIGVGKRWSRSMMKLAAARSGGYYTQINPDENIEWRSRDVLAILNTPRLLSVDVLDGKAKRHWLSDDDTLTHGQSLCAVTRLDANARLPEVVTIRGTVDGQPFERRLEVSNVQEGANYLPRIWARLEIDRLLARDADKNRQRIISLSKSMYVMSPFTSLLVLENEQMYKRYNIDRGRKDHWAMYPCPQKIKVVYQPLPRRDNAAKPTEPGDEDAKPGTPAAVARSIIVKPAMMRAQNYELNVPRIVSEFTRDRRANESDLRLTMSIRAARRDVLLDLLRKKTDVAALPDDPPLTYPDALLWEHLAMGRTTNSRSAPDDRLPIRLLPRFGRPRLADDDFSEDGSLLEAFEADPREAGALIVDTDFDIGARADVVKASVESRLERARRTIRDDPEAATRSLKLTVEAVRATPSISSADRADLLLRLEMALRSTAELRRIWSDRRANVIRRASAGREQRRIEDERNGTVDALPDTPAIIETGPSRDVVLEVVDGKALPIVVGSHAWTGRFMFGVGVNSDAGSTGTILSDDASILYTDSSELVRPEEEELRKWRKQLEQLIQEENRLKRDSTRIGNWRKALFDTNETNGRNEGGAWIAHDPSRPMTMAEFKTLVHEAFPSHTLQERTPPRKVFASEPYRPIRSGDVLWLAPGFQTRRADVLAVLDREVKANPPGPIHVDPRVRRLFSRARNQRWYVASIPDGRAGNTKFHFNLAGQFAYRRIVAGLREEVVCDGKNMWHLYPELSVGAKRSYSRFHRGELNGLVPWILLPVDEMAVDADLRLIAPHTVAVVPRSNRWLQSTADRRLRLLETRLVFGANGRLAERQLVTLPSEEIVVRQRYAADGWVTMLDRRGREVKKWQVKVQESIAANVVPNATRLLVVPMPLRSLEHLKESRGLDPAGNIFAWSKSDALAVIVSSCASGDASTAARLIVRRFVDPQRVEWWTAIDPFMPLLVTAGNGWHDMLSDELQRERKLQYDPLKQRPKSAIARYLVARAMLLDRGRGHAEFLAPLSESDNTFVSQLAEHQYVMHFLNNVIANGYHTPMTSLDGVAEREPPVKKDDRRPADPIPPEDDNPFASRRPTAVDIAKQVDICRRGYRLALRSDSDRRAWDMAIMLSKLTGDAGFHQSLANLLHRFDQVPGLGYASRYEQARHVLLARQTGDARAKFEQLYREYLAVGILPAIDQSFRDAFVKDNAADRWQELMTDTVDWQREHSRDGILVAMVVNSLGDRALANQLVRRVLENLPANQRISSMSLAIKFYWTTAQYEAALALVDRLLLEEQMQDEVALWELAEQLADQLERPGRAIQCREHVVALKYGHFEPDTKIDLSALRTDYGMLLVRYLALATDMTSEQADEAQLVERVISAADQWRSLESDPTQSCHWAYRVLTVLKAERAAWDYLVTPLAERPNEAPPWVAVAEQLSANQDVDRASRAFSRAFEAERANAEILWKHAQMLHSHGREAAARKVFVQIANGQWQPRFQRFRPQAREWLKTHPR